MKITESYLRKIIRGAINEMFSSADATPSFHDSPPSEEQPTQTPEELIDLLVSQIASGKVDSQLMSKLDRAIITAKNTKQQSSPPPYGESEFTPYGLGESRKRK